MSEQTEVFGDLDSLECLNRLECLEMELDNISPLRKLFVVSGWVYLEYTVSSSPFFEI